MSQTFYVDLDGKASIPKDPGATLDYYFDWYKWLGRANDSIASASARITGGCVIDSVTFLDGKVTIWVSGGTPLKMAALTCRITTTGGRTEERTVYLEVEDR